jgi:hypothetical protein
MRACIPAQVILDNEWPGLSGPLAVPVLLEPHGWSQVVQENISPDEHRALEDAMVSIASINVGVKASS